MPVEKIAFCGLMIVRIMRRSGMTIARVAQENQITQKRIREVRKSGVAAGFPSNEWHKMITGKWLEELPADQLESLAEEARKSRALNRTRQNSVTASTQSRFTA